MRPFAWSVEDLSVSQAIVQSCVWTRMEIYSCFNLGLAITIDWNRFSLILIPAWPETIDQCAELSSRFNGPTGPLFLFPSVAALLC